MPAESSPQPTDQSPNSGERLPLEPMDSQLKCIQPGGGVVVNLELAWGYVRRWWLKTMRPSYVERMRETRQGDTNGCPHEVLDSRDLKFYRNQPNYWWAAEDDPFRWRDLIPFARAGLAELLVFCLLTFGPAALLYCSIQCCGWTGTTVVVAWSGVAVFGVCGLLTVWFFRDPPRWVPPGDGFVISPADGTVSAIDDIEHDEYIGGPAVRIGIFLSIFNVHINRMPIDARVIGLSYKRGKYLNALKPESALENEQLIIRIEGNDAPHRRMVVKQIAGLLARRIVCWLKPGDDLNAGEQFGMIKLGSRTDLIVPKEDGLEITTSIGQKIKAGKSILVQYPAAGC